MSGILTALAGAEKLVIERMVPGPAPYLPPAAWLPFTAYVAANPYAQVTYGGETYVIKTSHTSGATFDATKWTKILAQSEDGIDGGTPTSVFT